MWLDDFRVRILKQASPEANPAIQYGWISLGNRTKGLEIGLILEKSVFKFPVKPKFKDALILIIFQTPCLLSVLFETLILPLV